MQGDPFLKLGIEPLRDPLRPILRGLNTNFYSDHAGSSLNLNLANGSNVLDSRVTFGRTSNGTSTNSAGLVANAPMNLLTFSEQFDNAVWAKDAVTVAANSIAAPDGTLTADKITTTLATSSQKITRNISADPTNTFSIYAKFAGVRYLLVNFTTVAGYGAVFDLVDGAVTKAPTQSGYSASIQSVGDGWYRCTWVKGVSTGGWLINFVLSSSPTSDSIATTISGDGTSGIYLWGVQQELGSTATTYNPTTVKNLLGYTENFDNAAWTKSNAFVQTNLVTYSQDFDNAAWSKAASSAAADTTVAPDGTTTADTLTFTGAGSSIYRGQAILTTGVTYTGSVWLKVASGTGTIVLKGAAGTGATRVTVTTEWQRFSVSYAAANTSDGLTIERTLAGDLGSVIAWGAQLVQGTSAGNYKATYATAAAVGYTDIYGQPFAQKLVEAATTSTHFLSSTTVTSVVASPLVYSIYAKQGERRYLGISASGPFGFASYDLQTGIATLGWAMTSVGMTDMGNGWYRCWMLYSPTASTTQLYTYCSANAAITSYTGDGTSGIYIFGAQLSDSASVDPYVYQPVAAPSSVAYYGPRFGYDPVTLQPKGLLIEEQRTNVQVNSENMSAANWIASNATVSVDSTVSPSGAITSDQITLTASNGYVLSGGPVSASSTATYSVYVKAGTCTTFRIAEAFYAGTSTSFNLATGTVTSGTGTIQNVGNGWYRCSFSFAYGVGQTNGSFLLGSTTTGNFYLWGAQLEAGAFATSYIPTVASQVTRAADSASIIGNNFARWFNVSAGTLFTQFDVITAPASATGMAPVSADNGAANGYLLYKGSVSATMTAYAGTNNAPIGNIFANTFAKAAVTYDGVSNAGVLNGAAPAAITASVVPTPTQLFIGKSFGGNQLSGHISRIAYYPRRLSNTELQGITS